MSPIRFLQEIQRRAGATAALQTPPDPLARAGLFIAENRDQPRARLLARVIEALARDKGEFREAEIAGFDQEALSLAAGLIEARLAGVYTQRHWDEACEQVKG